MKHFPAVILCLTIFLAVGCHNNEITSQGDKNFHTLIEPLQHEVASQSHAKSIKKQPPSLIVEIKAIAKANISYPSSFLKQDYRIHPGTLEKTASALGSNAEAGSREGITIAFSKMHDEFEKVLSSTLPQINYQ